MKSRISLYYGGSNLPPFIFFIPEHIFFRKNTVLYTYLSTAQFFSKKMCCEKKHTLPRFKYMDNYCIAVTRAFIFNFFEIFFEKYCVVHISVHSTIFFEKICCEKNIQHIFSKKCVLWGNGVTTQFFGRAIQMVVGVSTKISYSLILHFISLALYTILFYYLVTHCNKCGYMISIRLSVHLSDTLTDVSKRLLRTIKLSHCLTRSVITIFVIPNIVAIFWQRH